MSLEQRIEQLTPEQRELFDLLVRKERHNPGTRTVLPPRDATEAALAKIWSELLLVDPSLDDNYFELGGDSLTIIRMVTLARAAGIHLKAEWVFAHPTLAALAAACRQPDAPPAPPAHTRASAPGAESALAGIREADPEFERHLRRLKAVAIDAYPLSRSQQGILFHTLAHPGDGCYIVQWRFRLSGPLDVARLRAAWALLVQRHEAFRTIFQTTGVDEPMQVVLDRADAVIVEEDARPGREARIAEAFEEERTRNFDLRTPPLMRIRLLAVGPGEWVCLWTHHHLILDGWSQQVFLNELFLAYREQPLPPAPQGAFREHVRWLHGVHDETAADFWRTQFSGYEPAHASPALQTSGVHAVAVLSSEGGRSLQEALKHDGVTTSALFEAAWALALGELLASADVAFGVACSGRASGAPGIDQAVGLFINTLPMRLRLDRSLTLRAFVGSVQEQHASLVEYEWCGLPAVQRWIGWTRRAPLVDSLYVFEQFSVAFEALEVEGLTIDQMESVTHEHYPLVLVVQHEGQRTHLTLKYFPSNARDASSMQAALDIVASVGELYASAPDTPLGDIVPAAVLKGAGKRPTFLPRV